MTEMSTTPENMPGQRQLAVNIAVLICSLFLVLLMLEAGCRAHAYNKYRESLLFLIEQGNLGGSEVQKRARMGGSVGLGTIIKPSEHRDIIYELIPNLTSFYEEQWFHTTSHGFRDREYAVEKPPRTVRIVGLGDSVMCGQAAPQDGIYMEYLERYLNKAYPSVKWEVINTAVMGYNTVMEVETLKYKGLMYSPDLVILGWKDNDLCLPNFIVAREDYLTLRKSFLMALVSKRVSFLKGRFGSVAMGPDPSFADLSACTRVQAPPEYRGMVGEKAVFNSLDELEGLSRKHGFEVIVMFFPFHSDSATARVARHAEGLGFQIFDVQPEVKRYMKEHNIKEWKGSVLAASDSDNHPSPLGHRIASDFLLEQMDKRGIIKKLMGDKDQT
jgi:hypothetical protein